MKRLVVLLVAIAAAVALAGFYLPSNAATVAGTSISRQSLDSDLSVIAGSPDYACYLSEQRQVSSSATVPFLGAGTSSAKGGVYATAFVDGWLGSMMTDRVVAGVIARDGLHVTKIDLSTARSVLTRRITSVLDGYANDLGAAAAGCGGSAAAVLESLPSWFVAQQVRSEADGAVLEARGAGAGLTSGALHTYLGAHRATFDRDCISLIVVRTHAAANRVEKVLAGGVSFASEAASTSITTQSASSGGVAGCGLLADTFLASPLAKMSVGGVSKPVSAEGVYWVVQLTSRSTESFSSVRATVVTAILQAGGNAAGKEVAAALDSSSISVDPRYGSRSAHGTTLLVPPVPPPPSALLSAPANQPTPTTSS